MNIMTPQPLSDRSLLFVPATRPERFAKALASGADAVIVDLEDAVAPQDKSKARESAASALTPEHPLWIRINGAETEWFQSDLRLCEQAGVAGIILPKTEGAEVLQHIFSQYPQLPVLALIETARGIAQLESTARQPNVKRLLFGSIDLQLDLGMSGDYLELLPFRSQLVLHSRLAGLPAPVDGVTPQLDDLQSIRAEAQQAKRLGFSGKLCIHPSQVAAVNAAFLPSKEEVMWAERIVSVASAVNGSAVAVDGLMVDLPVLARARRILEISGGR